LEILVWFNYSLVLDNNNNSWVLSGWDTGESADCCLELHHLGSQSSGRIRQRDNTWRAPVMASYGINLSKSQKTNGPTSNDRVPHPTQSNLTRRERTSQKSRLTYNLLRVTLQKLKE
jgi:hypothetical protein